MSARRFALGVGGAAAASLLVAVIVYRNDLSWWWRMYAVDRVRVSDFALGEHELADQRWVDQAIQITREFVVSLRTVIPAEKKVLSRESAIDFLCSSATTHQTVDSVLLTHLEGQPMYPVIKYRNQKYWCGPTAWFTYVGRLLKPSLPAIIEAWRSMAVKPKQRFHLALCVMLLAPSTDGLADYLELAVKDMDALDLHTKVGAVFLCSELGPKAAVAAPSLRYLAENDRSSDLREFAKSALLRILMASPSQSAVKDR